MPLGRSNLLSVSGLLRSDRFDIPSVPSDVQAGSGRQLEHHAFVTARLEHATDSALIWSLTGDVDSSRVALNVGNGAGGGSAPSASGVSPSADDRLLRHAGVRADAVYERGRHQLKAGVDGHRGALDDAFELALATPDAGLVNEQVNQASWSEAAYVEDTVRLGRQVTAMGGVRWDVNRDPSLREQAIEPRAGLVAHVPHTPLVAHLNAGRFFQPPPLESLGLSGAVVAQTAGQAFHPVRAERSTQWEGGVTTVLGGFALDATYYQTHARNHLDHQQLGASSVFLPVNLAAARLRGLEVSVSSPSNAKLVTRLAYSLGSARATGEVTGGLGNLEPPATGFYDLDHDQRHTLVASLQWQPASRYWLCSAFRYGSGFLREDGPQHLSPHATVDLGAGLRLRPHWLVALEVENAANASYFINLASEFNGTHVARPRSAALRLRMEF